MVEDVFIYVSNKCVRQLRTLLREGYGELNDEIARSNHSSLLDGHLFRLVK